MQPLHRAATASPHSQGSPAPELGNSSCTPVLQELWFMAITLVSRNKSARKAPDWGQCTLSTQCPHCELVPLVRVRVRGSSK